MMNNCVFCTLPNINQAMKTTMIIWNGLIEQAETKKLIQGVDRETPSFTKEQSIFDLKFKIIWICIILYVPDYL